MASKLLLLCVLYCSSYFDVRHIVPGAFSLRTLIRKRSGGKVRSDAGIVRDTGACFRETVEEP